MSRRPWYKRYGGDFVLGTMALSLEEKGAYSLCLDLIYDRGGPIPDDARWLAGMCGVSLRKWASLRDRLIAAGKLVERDGCLTNARASREIAEAVAASAEHAENGAKGGRKRAENAAKPERNIGENDGGSSENNDLAQAGLKPIQKPEPEPDKKKDANASSVAEATPKPKGRSYPEAFEAAWKVYPHHKGRSSKPNAAAQFAKLPAEERVGLAAAIGRFAPNVAETCGGKGAPDMALWLRDGKHLNWGPEAATGAAPPAATFDGPPDLRAAIVRLKDEDFARRWLDHYCRWRPEDRTILAKTEAVASTLRRELAAYCADRRITIDVAPANDTPALFAEGEAA